MGLVGRRNTLAGAAWRNQGPQTAERNTLRRMLAGNRVDGLLSTWTTNSARVERGYLPPLQQFRMQANPIEPPPLPSLRGGTGRLATALPSVGQRYSNANDLGT